MKSRAILICLALLTIAAPAHAMNWSLGANLGLVVVDPTENGIESFTLIGWPSQGLFNIVASPGLRIGFRGEDPRQQFYLDSGFSHVSTDGGSFSSLQLSGNYQYNFAAAGRVHPYLTGGLGLVSVNADNFLGDGAAVSPIVGGGFGLQGELGHGHGTLRAEFRLDHVAEGKDNGATVIPATNNYGIKLGFDLWMK